MKGQTQQRKYLPVRNNKQNRANLKGATATNKKQQGNKSLSNSSLQFDFITSSGSSEALDQSNNTLTFPASNEDNISVVVRVRPLNDKEIKAGDEEVVQFPGNGQLLLEGGSVGQRPRLFSYHAVFGPGASQSDVLHFSGVERLLQLAVEGFSCTVFCYGQTGSGKTHTLTGPPGLFNGRPNPTNPDHGLVFSSFVVLFQLLSERQDTHFVLKASFLEIYNEKVIDLLNPGSARKPLAVRWTKKSRGFFVENLFTVDCEQLDDLLAVLEEGMRNRSVGAHSMNDHSSRSHTILTVHITSEQQMSEDGVFITKQGKINFVDLAGSEMTKKTHSEGKTLEEANNINKSLMVLGSCIASLSDAKKKSGHIPYRDSKLTKLLADSLAGAGVTLMIACVSPARSNYTETLNTLRYAARAKRIRTKPVIVMDPREALILTLKREVNALQSENEHLRMALQLGGPVSDPGSRRGSLDLGRRRSLSGPARSGILPWPEDLGPPPAAGDTSRLAELAPEDLAKMAEHFLQENEALRRENSELFSTRESLLRDQELVCRENERLLRKLEDVNSVCCRSPIIPARPTYSADRMQNQPGELSQADVWTNPLAQNDTSVVAGPRFKQEIINDRTTLSKPPHRLPDSIQKELDKRRIGFNKSMTNLADAPGDTGGQGNMLLRHASWESPFIETGAEEAPAVRSVKKKLRETQARKDATGAKAAHDAAGRPEVDFQSPSPTARPNNPFGSLLSLREEQRLGY